MGVASCQNCITNIRSHFLTVSGYTYAWQFIYLKNLTFTYIYYHRLSESIPMMLSDRKQGWKNWQIGRGYNTGGGGAKKASIVLYQHFAERRVDAVMNFPAVGKLFQRRVAKVSGWVHPSMVCYFIYQCQWKRYISRQRSNNEQ